MITLVTDNYELAILIVLSVHAVAVALLSAMVQPLLPEKYRKYRVAGFLVFFIVGFTTFVVGYIILIGLYLLLKSRRQRPVIPYETIAADDIMEEDFFFEGRKFGEGAFAELLQPDKANIEAKQKVFLGFADFRTPTAFEIIKQNLSSPVDEIRLYVFGILNNAEKEFVERIHSIKKALPEETNRTKRAEMLKELAQTYYDLFYFNIVDDSIKPSVLNEAIMYAEQSIRENPEDPSAYVVLGKACLKKGDYDAASRWFEMARRFNMEESKTIPYLAEIYFNRGDFQKTRELLSQMDVETVLNNHLRSIVVFWKGI